jgi:hypothetical protein
MLNPIRGALIFATLTLSFGSPRLRAQASAIPSAQTGDDASGNAGRKLLDSMVTALGGEKWLNRTTWIEFGKTATFYKGAPNPDTTGFEDYSRAQPFGERVVLDTESPRILVQMLGGIPSVKTSRDIAFVYTPTDAFSVDYKGKTELPKDELQDYLRRRKFTLDVIVKVWAHEPGAILTDGGTEMVDRRLADRLTILTPDNQSAVLELDDSTHLPISRTVVYRDPLYKDQDTDIEQYDNYQTFAGIPTPMTITRLHNGDIVAQRFLTKVEYNVPLADDLFNPDRPLQKKAKK